jgi:hypothetical protein
MNKLPAATKMHQFGVNVIVMGDMKQVVMDF